MKSAINKRPVGRPPKTRGATPLASAAAAGATAAAAAAASPHGGTNPRVPRDPEKELKWVLECPTKVLVYKLEWFLPGQRESWREMYMASHMHVVASFGAEILADKLKVSIQAVAREGMEHKQASSNARAFSQTLKAARAAKAAAEAASATSGASVSEGQSDAAAALTSLASPSSADDGSASAV